MCNEKLVLNQFLDTQIICVCSTLIVNSQEPTALHRMVTSPDQRSDALFAMWSLTMRICLGPSVNTMVTDFVYILAYGDGQQVNS